MSTLATDSFDRANGGLGANWTTDPGPVAWAAPTIVSNRCDLTTDPSGAYYNAITPPADQWAQCTLTQVNTSVGDGTGPALRVSTVNGAQYFVQASTIGTQIWYVDAAGAFNSKGTPAVTWATNDVCYMEIQGTSGILKKNGVQVATFAATELASGRFGVSGSGGPDTVSIDDFSAGDFVQTSFPPVGGFINPVPLW